MENFNQCICPELKVSWCVELEDGTKIFDDIPKPGHVSEWVKLRDYLNNRNLIIKNIHLFSIDNADANTGEFCGAISNPYAQYYFFCRKTIASFMGHQIDLWGIGCSLPEDPEILKIYWYNSGMGCESSETRHISKATISTIKNNVKTECEIQQCI